MPTLIATHTSGEMKGAGKSVGSFPGDIFGPLIMQFNNGETPGYFFMEQETGVNSGNGIPQSTTDYAAGSVSNLVNLSNDGIVLSAYKLGIAVPPGTSSMVFSAVVGDGSGRVRLRSTSNFNLEIFDQ